MGENFLRERKNPENQNLQEYLIALYSYLKGACSQFVVSLFSQATSSKARGHRLKLWLGSFMLDIKKVVGHWNGLATNIVELPSVEVFKEQLDVALSAMVCWCGGVRSRVDDLGGLFQEK